MHRSSVWLAVLAALVLLLVPGLAAARLGSGSSMGSRGTMTWSAPPRTPTAPYAAQPLQRSVTPTPGYNTYRPSSGFMSGLLGGFIGAGIGGLLFGHGFFGFGHGFGGFVGLLLQVLLLVLLVRFVVGLFRSPSPMFASNPPLPGGGVARPMSLGGGPPGAPPLQIGPQDYQAFEQLLYELQAAWSRHDLNALREMVTPEMLGYFAEQLAEQTSRGVRNEVSDVRLLQGDLAQAWRESNREYATVAMRFSMVDVTRDASARIIDGSPNEHVTTTELWTFVRSSGGRWILSAIQQAR